MKKHWYIAYQNDNNSAKNLKLSPHMAWDNVLSTVLALVWWADWALAVRVCTFYLFAGRVCCWTCSK